MAIYRKKAFVFLRSKFWRFFLTIVRRKLQRKHHPNYCIISNVPFNFLFSLCAEVLACAHLFWEFSQNFVSETKAVFVSELRWRQKKVFTQNRSVFVSVNFIVVIFWSTTICLCKNMSVRSKFFCVRSRWSLCARAQLRGNTDHWHHVLIHVTNADAAAECCDTEIDFSFKIKQII